MNNRSIAISTIGYMCIGMFSTLGSLRDLGAMSGPDNIGSALNLALGCGVISVVAVLAVFYCSTLDAIIFAAAAGFALTVHNIAGADSHISGGWFFLLWAIFFFYVWLAALKAGWPRMLYLLGVWLAMFGFCLLYFTRMDFFGVINGCAGLIGGLMAFYISAAELLNDSYGKVLLPLGRKHHESQSRQ